MKTQIHTFELITNLTCDEYHTCRDHFFEDAKGRRGWCFQGNPQRVTYTRWQEHGIIIYLDSGSPVIYLRMKVNPSKLLGSTDALTLFNVTEASVGALTDAMQEIISLLPVELLEESIRLSRLDLCRNLTVPSQAVIDEYLRLLQKGAKQKNWDAQHYDDDRGLHSFRRINNLYKVTVYDKLYQIQDRGLSTEWNSSDRILRAEISLLPKGIQYMCGKFHLVPTDWALQLYGLSQCGTDITNHVLKKLIGPGDYYSLEAAKGIITTIFSRAKALKLIQFLSDINRSQVVDKQAVKEHTNGKNRLKELRSCNINPVTIECRAGIDCLPSLFVGEGIVL